MGKKQFRIHYRRSFIMWLRGMAILAVILFLWTESAEKKAHFTPEYEKADLTPLLKKPELTQEDYDLFLVQTGLGRTGVDELYRQGRQEELLYLQRRFFEPVEYECSVSLLVCRSERLVQRGEDGAAQVQDGGGGDLDGVTKKKPYLGDFLPAVQSGDILISFNGHFLGWRSGHAAIVTDAVERKTLEAISVGIDSRICSLESWREYPSFILMRLKGVSEEERGEIAAYAEEALTGLPYRLLSLCGVEGEGTQCAHLVWRAFRHFGYNLDSDGGYIVTPYDIYQSSLLEVIQYYGILPNI
ncbi:MAG: hypothetical protein ACI4HQ_12380 [Acetatifactor sp.]